MRKLKKHLDEFLCLVLCSLLVGSTISNPYNMKADDFSILDRELSIPSIQAVEKKWSEKLSLKEKCLSNGKKTAIETNELKNNKSAFRKKVRIILDNYFSTPKSQRKQLDNFIKYIDDSAEFIVENYIEAEEERDNQENLDYETGKVIVSFPYGTSMEIIENIMEKEVEDYEVIDDGKTHIADDITGYRKKRLEKIKDWKSDVVVEADITLEDTVERAEEKFEKYDCVKSVSDNTFFEADGTIKTSYTAKTNDDDFNEEKQWNLKNVDVPRAWNRFKTVNCLYVVRVAVIDCGVQMNHKELSGVLMKNKSVDVTQTVKGSYKKLIECDDKRSEKGQYTGAHGTGVTSVLAAKGNNDNLGAGIASIANNEYRNSFEIMAVKCDNSLDKDRHITKGSLAKAVKYAVDNGAEVINISYSAPKSKFDNEDNFSELEKEIKRAIAADVCVVCAAGSVAGTNVRYPAGFPGVIGVGATWKNGKLAEYSNESTAVDIVAPGGYENGARTYMASPTTINPKGYRYSEGTSYATPLVAGTIAMMLSINCILSPSQILSRLQDRSTSTVCGRINKSKKFKVLNAGKSVALMKEE